MSTNVLLLGRTAIDVRSARTYLGRPDIEVSAGTSLDDVRRIFEAGHVDIVIMGAGIDLATRLAIVEHIFDVSTSTTVHMKDWDSGPQGMLPFVKGVLSPNPPMNRAVWPWMPPSVARDMTEGLSVRGEHPGDVGIRV